MRWIQLSAVVALLGTAAPAQADGFVEAVAGLAAPLGDDTYTDAVGSSLKVGVRAGPTWFQRNKAGIGLELGVDWTPLSSRVGIFENERFHRLRVLGGLRLAYPLGPWVTAIVRLAAGADYTRVSFGGRVLGIPAETTTRDDLGIALDSSVGVQAALGATFVGVAVGLPIGIHDEQGVGFKLDYTSVDLDILFVVTGPL